MWIGICITTWAKIEEHLFRICERCLGARTDRAAIVYYRTPNIDSRVQLVDELVRTMLPKREKKSGSHDHQDLKEWDDLRKNIVELLRIRSRIAHHPVVARGDFGVPGGVGLLQAKTWHISDAERLRVRSSDVPPLKQDDLVNHSRDVHAIATRLTKFLREILPKHS